MTPPSPNAAKLVELDARIGEAVAAMGLLPAGVHGAFRERIYDLLSHHRDSVLKHHGLPGGRRAQKWLATRLFRFTRAVGGESRIAELMGEGFGAAVSGETFGPGALRQVEFGGTMSGEMMAIPAGRGRANPKEFRRLLALRGARGGLDVAPSGALVREAEGRRHGLRSELWGVLRRTRRQPRQLGYYARFADVQSRHAERFEADLDRAMTAAGREALAERARDRGLQRGVYVGTLRKYLEQNPGKHAEARRVAAAAARAARAAGITGSRERA